jgi:hypothetical protein
MPSTYTTANGIELIATGEQSGSWGTTTNQNLQIVDRVLSGVGSITLSGTTHTLSTTDGTLSDGMYKVLVLVGSPSGTNTITVAPNDAQKTYMVYNNSGQSAIFTQGSGSNVTVANGDTKMIYMDGIGSGASVVDFTANLSMSSVNITGGTVAGSTITGDVDGRDVSVDGTKLDDIEDLADVTDVTNVTSAGALMDSEVTNLAQVKAFDETDYATAAQGTLAANALPKSGGALSGAVTTNSTFDGRDVAADGTKLDDIEALADVTDATNVTSAGALMDSEVTNLAQVKAFDETDYATAAQGSKADSALQDADIGSSVQGYAAVLANTTASFLTADETKLDNIEAFADVTDTTNVVASLTAGTNVTIAADGTIAASDGNELELYAENPVTPIAPSATGNNAVAIGSGSISAATNSISINTGDASYGVIAGATNSIAIGYQSRVRANVTNGLAIGYGTDVNNTQSTAVGYNATAFGSNSQAFGSGAYSSTDRSLAIGFNAFAGTRGSTALGSNAGSQGSVTATGDGAMALGGSYASGADSFAAAIANNTSSYGATGANSLALGDLSKATAANSVAIGDGAISTTANLISLGGTTDTVQISGAFKLPTSDGTAGQVLSTDGSGNLSWVTP